MKRHLKKVVLAMIAFVLCGVMNVTGSNVSLAATDVETEQTAELEAASTVKLRENCIMQVTIFT